MKPLGAGLPIVSRHWKGIAAIVLATSNPGTAWAQRAGENAVTAAQDVFGTTIGNETIGIYTTEDVRGFSPLKAGNVRIEGLYFDKVGDENDRIQESSRIRVGIADQGYAFPAPTGIVDYALRIPGDAANLSVQTEASTYGYYTVQIDGTKPLDDTLGIGGGIGANRNISPSGSDNYEGNIGVIAKWTPLPNLEILPFWSRKDTYAAKDGEAYEPLGDFLPSPMPQHHFFGPPWARGQDFSINYGSLFSYSLSSWVARLGIFRSELTNPKSSFPQLANLTASGHGELEVDLNPPSHLGSTSGEFRLEKSFTDGPWVHRLLFSLRGRNWNGVYGNSVTEDAGPQTINQVITTPRPAVQYPAAIHDHVDERWIGFQYQLARRDWFQISLGVQKSRYHKRTLVPGRLPSSIDDSPWLLTGSATADLTDTLAAFAGYTQGLEDNGISPSNAANSNEALPATTSRQKEGGVRWMVLPRTSFVATIFDLKKAYFNLDPSNVFRELGGVENKGVELSLSGNLMDGLDIVAGGVFSQPRVSGDAVRLGVSGDKPVGIYSRKFVLGTDWSPSGWPGHSFDLNVNYYGSVPSTLDDRVAIAAYTTVDWDTRYQFQMMGQSASLKFAVMNMFNLRAFEALDAGTYGFFQNSGRRFDLRLIVDVS